MTHNEDGQISVAVLRSLLRRLATAANAERKRAMERCLREHGNIHTDPDYTEKWGYLHALDTLATAIEEKTGFPLLEYKGAYDDDPLGIV